MSDSDNPRPEQRIQNLLNAVDPQRLRDMTLELLRRPSPSGQERDVSEYYAACLQSIGLEVDFDREFPQSPSVIARLPGQSAKPVLQLDGHTDTIAPPGPPVGFKDGWIYGRGAEDMKGALAAMAEAARVLHTSGLRLSGGLLLTAHGLHESGTNETVESLIRKGIHGDAVIVTELGLDGLPIAGMGLVIFEIRIRRKGEEVHELNHPANAPHPLRAGGRCLQMLDDKDRELKQQSIPYLGTESIFVGKFQCGDYFNRVPLECVIVGARRYGPGRRFADIRKEFDDLARALEQETGTSVDVSLSGNGLGSFCLAETEPLVRVVRAAHERITGAPLGLTGTRGTGNVSNFINSAGVPAVYYGPRSLSAHSANERVALDDLVRVTHVLICAIADYLGFDPTT